MVDMSRAPGRVQEKEIRSNLSSVEIKELLRDANISEIKARLPAGVSQADIEKFLRDQYGSFKGQILQEADIKVVEAAYPPPELYQHRFAIHHTGTVLTPEEVTQFNLEMRQYMESSGFKAMAASKGLKSTGSEDSVTPMTDAEIADAAQGTLGEVQGFMDETWSMIMDAQMMQDMESKSNEIKAEVERIINLVKQGAIGPEFALIALAKVNATKNGVLMTWLGKKASHINESLNNISNDLSGMSPGSPDYYSSLTVAQNRTREGALQLNLLTTDMQKVMQDCAQVLEQVKSMMDMMTQGRRQITQNMKL
ncbi:MAG TPA: hypothetical protein PLZ86_00075 [bacterium]|nr:hypothetical protein [bacterium]